jgi:hypothetical protein
VSASGLMPIPVDFKLRESPFKADLNEFYDNLRSMLIGKKCEKGRIGVKNFTK